MGTPCPLCPITVWQRMRDLEERRSQRRMQRRAELRPDNSSRRQHPQIAAGLHSEGSSGGKGGLPGRNKAAQAVVTPSLTTWDKGGGNLPLYKGERGLCERRLAALTFMAAAQDLHSVAHKWCAA
eukprot:scaffold251236_cov28-Tisochrysis_lutea.AAC.1